MKYKNSISAALNGLFRSQIAKPHGNGMLDAMKLAEGESTIAKNNAGIGRDNAETDKITRRLQDLYSPEFQQELASGMLPNATPEQRAASVLNSLRITDNPERVTSAYGDGLNQSYYDQALNNPEFAKQFNTANAAKGGKLYSDVGSTGLTLDQSSGGQFVGNNQQFNSNLGKTRSEVGKNNAQAGQANSATAYNNWRTTQPQNTIGYNTDGGMVLVDKRTGQSMPVNGQNGEKVMGRPKPKLPPTALKMQQDNIEQIGAASGINAQLSRVESQLETGKLRLSPMDRVTGFVRNNTNSSNEESRNLASFQSALEKMRNDSLRLNTGVQTDGDAKRAWNELMNNINDTELVKQRIKEIKEINNRAIELRKMQIEEIRNNFGAPQMQNYGDGIGGSTQNDPIYDFSQLPD